MPRLIVIIAWAFGLFMIALKVYVTTGDRHDLTRFVHHVPGADKTGHFVLMGLLAFLVVMATARDHVLNVPNHVLKWSGISAIIVTAEEFAQQYSPNRTYSLLDLAASLSGIVVFSLFGAGLLRRYFTGHRKIRKKQRASG